MPRTLALPKAGPPRALPLRKAASSADCLALEQIPNIGRSLAGDLRSIGVATPAELAGYEPLALYKALCLHSGEQQDPCVLDSFMAAVDFMRGAVPTPWWHYTETRKKEFGRSGADLARLKLSARMPNSQAELSGHMSPSVRLEPPVQSD